MIKGNLVLRQILEELISTTFLYATYKKHVADAEASICKLIPSEEEIVDVMTKFWKTSHPRFRVEYAEYPDGGWKARFRKEDVAQAIHKLIEKRLS